MFWLGQFSIGELVTHVREGLSVGANTLRLLADENFPREAVLQTFGLDSYLAVFGELS